MTTPSSFKARIDAPVDSVFDTANEAAERTGALDTRSPYIVALDSVMSRLESIEDRQQRLEAERVAVLADAFDVLATENGTAYGSIPTGKSGEIAYRALRAEIAMVTGVTEPLPSVSSTTHRHCATAIRAQARPLPRERFRTATPQSLWRPLP